MIVVGLAPVAGDPAHVTQASEPVLGQVVPRAAVEALDVGVLHRLTVLDKGSSTPFLAVQICMVPPASSDPLSVRITLGKPRSTLTWSSTRMRHSGDI